MPRMKLKTILLLGSGLALLLALVITLSVRDDGEQRALRLREQQELERAMRNARVLQAPPQETFERFRRAHALDAQPSSPTAQRARTELVKHGESAVPFMRAAIYSPTESAVFRIELIAVLGEMKEAGAESLLVAIFGDRSLEDRFRTAALAQITNRPGETIFAALRKVFTEEPSFPHRHLVLKAIGTFPHPESTAILLTAAKSEAAPGSRIQALDSLGRRIETPGTLALVRDVLLGDPEENVRLASLACMGKSADPAVDATLKELLDHPQTSPALKKAAASWIERRKAN